MTNPLPQETLRQAVEIAKGWKINGQLVRLRSREYRLLEYFQPWDYAALASQLHEQVVAAGFNVLCGQTVGVAHASVDGRYLPPTEHSDHPTLDQNRIAAYVAALLENE